MIAWLKYGLFFCFIFCLEEAKGKSAQALIDSAYYLYDYENFDPAKNLFQSIYNNNEPNVEVRLEAVTGLLKIAVFKVKLAEADSLNTIGNSILIKEPKVSIATRLRFNQAAAEYYRSSAQFDEALKLHQKVLKESQPLLQHPLIYAYSNLYVAATFERISESDSALVYANIALSQFLKLFPEDHVKLSSVYNILGTCHYRLSNYNKATEFYMKTVANTKKNIKKSSYYQTMAYGNLAAISNNIGKYEEALKYVEMALAINKELGEQDGIGFNYFSLAVTYYYLGDFGRTKDYANACLEIRKKLYDENHYRMSVPIELLGIVYELSEDFPLAIKYLKMAKAIKINSLGEDNIEVAYSNENIALCFLKLGEIDSASHYINLATAILPYKISKNHLSLGTHYFTLANIKLQYKDYDGAINTLQKSKNIYELLGLTKTNEYAQNLALEASIYAEQKQYDKAQVLFDAAINTIQINGDKTITSASFPLSETALSIINSIVDYSFDAYMTTKKADYLRQTQLFSDIFLEINDHYRKQFNDPFTKTSIIQRSTKGLEMGVSIQYQLLNLKPSEAQKEAFFKYAEMGRTTLFRDLIDDYKVRSFAGIPDSLLQKEQKIKLELADLHSQLSENPNSDSLKKQLFLTKENFNQHIKNYQSINPNYYNLKFKKEDLTLKDIQTKVLKPEENLIEYVVDDTAFYAILIQKEKVSIHYLANKQKITKLVEQWQKSITNVQLQASDKIGFQLYKLLIHPIAHQFSGNRLIIIPTHALFYLNFEALKQNAAPNSYLIYDYIIHYGLSSNVLYQQNQTKTKIKGVPIVVAPGFEKDLKEVYKKSVKNEAELDNDYLKTVRQPWSVKFANFISKKYRGKALIGDVASEANVKQNLNKHPIIHFATHAVADEDDPLRSKLVLSKDADRSENDGYLHTYEIYNLNLQTELAVLSACESGIGNLQKGEGMISLAYSMNYAGCPSVIMSLWKIDEKTNTEITTSFYKYLAKGNDISSSLRAAKLDYLERAKGTLAHPFYWSGLVLMGKNSTIDIPSPTLKWKIILPIILLLLLVITAFIKHQKNKL
jgi:CHAT domain-containing protein